ncbi:MAG: hypothetical protein ABGX05_10115 [Pirellulaceae bacterium]
MISSIRLRLLCSPGGIFLLVMFSGLSIPLQAEIDVREDDEQIQIETPHLKVAIRKKGYVSGVAAGSFLDKKSGFRDIGFGLDIADWIMEPGSDEKYRDQLDDDLVYRFGNEYHGARPKRCIEGPQICTKAGELDTRVIRGADFVAVKLGFQYHKAAPGRNTGSRWTQTLVFPGDQRYFLSSHRIEARNESDAMFVRIDMPGHIKHQRGDTFSEIYLSYLGEQGRIASDQFLDNFAPDEKYNYRRDLGLKPRRFIRAYHVRDPRSGAAGPWLAGMTLDPSLVHEAWCHQRGYVCLIEEFGGRPVKAGETFGAAFVVGFFDSIGAMEKVYDRHRGFDRLSVDRHGWKLRRWDGQGVSSSK